MARAQVILQLDKDRAVVRSGDVVYARGSLLSVRWSDGTAEDVRPGRAGDGMLVAMPAGSLEHWNLTDAAGLQATIASSPEDVFTRAIADQAESVTSLKLIERISHVSSREIASAAWKRARPVIEASPDVKASAGRPTQYRLTEEAAARLLAATFPFTSVSPAATLEVRRVSADVSERISTPATALGGEAQSAQMTEEGLEPPEAAELKSGISGATQAAPAAEDAPATAAPAARPLDSAPTSEPTGGPKDPAGTAQSTASRQPAQSELLSVADLAGAFRSAAQGKPSASADELEPSVEALQSSAVRVLFDALNPERPSSRRATTEMVLTPLASALVLAEFPGDSLIAALERVGAPIAAALLGLPKRSKVADGPALRRLLDVPSALGLLGRARTELRDARRKANDTEPYSISYGFMVERVSTLVPPLPLTALVEAWAEVDPPSLDERRAGVLVAALASSVQTGGGAAWSTIDDPTRALLAGWTARVPLDHPARGRMLEALVAIDAAEAAKERWWAGVTFDDLAKASAGPVSRVVADRHISGEITMPRTLAALEGATTRRRLMAVLGAPTILTELIPPALVKRAVERVAADDRQFRAWIGEVRGEVRVAALERTLADHQMETEELRSALQLQTERELSAVERALHLERRLNDAVEATSELRTSQERQIKIDAVRALAELAAFVIGALERQAPDRIAERVGALAGRQGLVSLGTPGGEVTYDPMSHDLIGAPAEPGVVVVVRRVGYTWKGPEGEIVLVRALVDRRT